MSSDPTTEDVSGGGSQVRVELRENGPIVITGAVNFDDGTDPVQSERLFLCRCGQSNKKPMCDGTHKRVGFVANGCQPPKRS